MNKCSVHGCGNKHNCKGLCKKHYDQTRREKRDASTLRYRANNQEKIRSTTRSWWKNNPIKRKEYSRKWRTEHPDERKRRNQEWCTKNADAHRENARQWGKNNLPRVLERNARRKASQLNATPVWATVFFMREAYRLARLRTELFGFPWHVDHIVPLKSKRVCGLHCEFNLRVIPGRDNIVKNNRTWPDMP